MTILEETDSLPAEEFKVSGIVATAATATTTTDTAANRQGAFDGSGSGKGQHQQPATIPTTATSGSVSAVAPVGGSSNNNMNVDPAVAHQPGNNQQSTSVTTRRRKKQYAVSTQWERAVAEGRAPKDVHSYFCCCARRIGNMFAVVSYPDGSPLVLAGPCWPFCVFFTVPFILGVSVLISYFMIIDKGRFDLVRHVRTA